MIINSNLNVQKITNVQKSIKIVKGSIQGSYRVLESLRSEKITTSTATADTFYTHRITGKKGSIFLLGDLVVTRMRTEKPVTLDSFFQAKESTWLLHLHDSFEQNSTNWSGSSIQNCNHIRGSFYGGHCQLSTQEISRQFKNLKNHSQVMIKSTFHFFDNWQGEMAYMKVNGETVWMKNGIYPKKISTKIPNCGNDDFSDPLMNQFEKILE